MVQDRDSFDRFGIRFVYSQTSRYILEMKSERFHYDLNEYSALVMAQIRKAGVVLYNDTDPNGMFGL